MDYCYNNLLVLTWWPFLMLSGEAMLMTSHLLQRLSFSLKEIQFPSSPKSKQSLDPSQKLNIKQWLQLHLRSCGFNLLIELKVPMQNPPRLFCDNIGATYLCSNLVLHSPVKHISLDYHFVREQVQGSNCTFCMSQQQINW